MCAVRGNSCRFLWHRRQRWLSPCDGGGDGDNAACNQAAAPCSAALWHATQSSRKACGPDKGPGERRSSRDGPATTTTMSPSVSATVARTARPRLARRLRTGWQVGTGREHAPSGMGPCSHLPPQLMGRAHSQRSPVRIGVHSEVARHRPRSSGPTWHARPRRAQPHSHFWVGRS